MKSDVIPYEFAEAHWDELLERAVNGEVLKIRRFGVTFYLGTAAGLAAGQQRVVDAAMNLGQQIEKHNKGRMQYYPTLADSKKDAS